MDMDSILTSTKKLLGIAQDYEHFDADIIMHINSVFMILTQMGIGPSKGFRINDKASKWSEFTSDDITLEAVKSYMHLKVKLLFDPPANSSITNAMNNMISELEWRLYVAAEPNACSREEENQNG